MVYAGAIELHCEDCSQRSEAWRKMHGCLGPGELVIYEVDGDKIYECPGKLILPEVVEFLNLYSMCKVSQTLPVDGGVLAQTNIFIEAAAVVEKVVGDVQEAEAKKTSHGSE